MATKFGVEIEFLREDANEDTWYSKRCESKARNRSDYWYDDYDDVNIHDFLAKQMFGKNKIKVLGDKEYYDKNCSYTKNQDIWKLTEDGSLYDDDDYDAGGLELVSPPIPFTTSGLEQVKKVFQSLNRSKKNFVNESCGLHVHVDASFAKKYSASKQEAFLKFLCAEYAEKENYFDSLVDESRRKNENEYCRSMKQMSNQKLLTSYDRYRKLNVCAFNKHGTIEFRHHHGTLSSREALKWIKICVNFMEQARKDFEASWNARQTKKKKKIPSNFRLAA